MEKNISVSRQRAGKISKNLEKKKIKNKKQKMLEISRVFDLLPKKSKGEMHGFVPARSWINNRTKVTFLLQQMTRWREIQVAEKTKVL
mgnify:CR=1 FL=1